MQPPVRDPGAQQKTHLLDKIDVNAPMGPFRSFIEGHLGEAQTFQAHQWSAPPTSGILETAWAAFQGWHCLRFTGKNMERQAPWSLRAQSRIK